MKKTKYDYVERSARRLLELGATPAEIRAFLDARARMGDIDWGDNLMLRLELLDGETQRRSQKCSKITDTSTQERQRFTESRG